MTHSEPILHVDMDAFYASVEQRDHPQLQGRPVVVGGYGDRGVVAAASYESRRYGIRSAMPMVRARRLCADLVVVEPRFDAYREASQQVMSILRDVTPLVEPLSLDEAFLDVSGAIRLFGDPPAIGAMIRTQIRDEVALPASVGVGPTKSVAKLLSGRAKPDGLLHWRAEEVAGRLRTLDVAVLWGAGPRTVERLRSYGLHTVGAIADADRSFLRRVVGEALADHLARLAIGEDPRSVQPHEPARSISAEQTFATDIRDADELRRNVLQLAQRVGRRLRAANLAGRTITLKVRLAPFETLTRSTTVAAPTDSTHELVQRATALLDGLALTGRPVRLLGVGVSNFGIEPPSRQLTLASGDADGSSGWIESDRRWEEVERVADSVAERFAGVEVSYASLLDAHREGRGEQVEAAEAQPPEAQPPEAQPPEAQPPEAQPPGAELPEARLPDGPA